MERASKSSIAKWTPADGVSNVSGASHNNAFKEKQQKHSTTYKYMFWYAAVLAKSVSLTMMQSEMLGSSCFQVYSKIFGKLKMTTPMAMTKMPIPARFFVHISCKREKIEEHEQPRCRWQRCQYPLASSCTYPAKGRKLKNMNNPDDDDENVNTGSLLCAHILQKGES